MSKLVNRIFKHKSKTLDDYNGCAVISNGDSKVSTFPRSKTTHLNVANGRSTSPPLASQSKRSNSVEGRQKIVNSPGVPVATSKSVSSPPRHSARLVGQVMSPVPIPVEEALLLIAEDPPRVARCTPKGTETVDTKRWKEEHDMRHCIYDRAVYERMIENSLKTCQLLQTNLDTYITRVRETPSPIGQVQHSKIG